MKSVVNSNFKALILAAGLGTRLKPFTDHVPKALFLVEGKTLLEHAIDHIKDHGISNVIINVHHFADQVVQYLETNRNFGINITISDETGDLLDTGGGLKKTGWFFHDNEPFLVRNVDVISNLNLQKLFDFHSDNHSLSTLVVRERETSRYFLFDDELNLCGWINTKKGEKKMTRNPIGGVKPLAFSGIQVVNPEIFTIITENGKFSLTELYLRLSADHQIKAFIDHDSYWKDEGKQINP